MYLQFLRLAKTKNFVLLKLSLQFYSSNQSNDQNGSPDASFWDWLHVGVQIVPLTTQLFLDDVQIGWAAVANGSWWDFLSSTHILNIFWQLQQTKQKTCVTDTTYWKAKLQKHQGIFTKINQYHTNDLTCPKNIQEHFWRLEPSQKKTGTSMTSQKQQEWWETAEVSEKTDVKTRII